jgi:hypothetical protein
MKITGIEHIQGNGLLLRPITEQNAELIVSATVSDIPDWTFIPRDLDQAAARAWIQRGFSTRENGQITVIPALPVFWK